MLAIALPMMLLLGMLNLPIEPVFGLFQQPIQQWSFVEILILIIIVAACIGILFIALQVFGITIPDWAIKIFWIVVVAFVAIMAIRLVAGM
jgi:hypothetical protein